MSKALVFATVLFDSQTLRTFNLILKGHLSKPQSSMLPRFSAETFLATPNCLIVSVFFPENNVKV